MKVKGVVQQSRATVTIIDCFTKTINLVVDITEPLDLKTHFTLMTSTVNIVQQINR